MKHMAVTTNDRNVRRSLRMMEEPITLFGEKEMERRERLMRCIAQRERKGQALPEGILGETEGNDGTAMDVEEDWRKEIFYTIGSERLETIRRGWAVESLQRAKARIGNEKDEDQRTERQTRRTRTEQNGQSLALEQSQVAHPRPVVGCSLSTRGDTVATCSWDGKCRLWDANDLRGRTTFAAHEERCTDVRVHPSYRTGTDGPCAATGSSDRTAKLWDERGRCLATYEGHADRLARLAFHPFGGHLATTSFDRTWRLWDLTTGTELLLQEGHSRAVYALAFQRDGSWAVSVGLDAVGWVWDLRTGRHITTLNGHVKPILAVDVSPDGYTVATAGEDHVCKLWDLRQRRCIYTLPAHSSLISTACFETGRGDALLTGSYDGTLRVWSTASYACLNTLEAHEGKVAAGALAMGAGFVVSAGFDKTLKRWRVDQEEDLV